MAKIELPAMVAAAKVIYGEQFNPLISLKALAYHDDSSLTDLPGPARRDLIAVIKGVDLDRLPQLAAVRSWGGAQ
jgi:hypothetical protein